MSHNSDGVVKSPALSAPDLPFRLTGSQAKTAYALRKNVEAMINGNGPQKFVAAREDADGKEIPAHMVCTSPEFLNATAFLTLTVGDDDGGKFRQVFDAAEASRRFNNLNRRVLKDLFARAVVVTERHKNGAIHFHLVGVLRGAPDIRSTFDFKSFREAREARDGGRVNKLAEQCYKAAASDELRGIWATLREVLPNYGFGRAELTPIEKTGEAVACYVSKYIEKNICNRLKDDKRKKLVRYVGEWRVTKEISPGVLQGFIGRRVAVAGEVAPDKIRPNDFGWGSVRAIAWRCKARELAGFISIVTPADAAQALGPRWAYRLTTTWQGRTEDSTTPFLIADYDTKRRLTNDLASLSRNWDGGKWMEESETPWQPTHTDAEAFALWGKGTTARGFNREFVGDDFDAEAAAFCAPFLEKFREILGIQRKALAAVRETEREQAAEYHRAKKLAATASLN